MIFTFVFDERLDIEVPKVYTAWNHLDAGTQEEILTRWERSRGQIPDRIKELDQEIEKKQQLLYNEDDFEKSCRINEDIAELASIINDLWIWYRSTEAVTITSL
ncbi:hypothetical protein JSY36_11860 [Bacillus sp. H-16]|uniref:hypothetical protein n=1 Tax=Alteribacter salitolerans TaxID=2912333 RepID=UPI001964A9CE|nr:hypothetical protein [Alteribacter salitolerans]MBM7096441.1 hypothetical protein [Alteribacter salitolerans]